MKAKNFLQCYFFRLIYEKSCLSNFMIKKGIGTKNMFFLNVNTIIDIKSIILNVKIGYRILFRANIVQKVTKTFLQSMKI